MKYLLNIVVNFKIFYVCVFKLFINMSFIYLKLKKTKKKENSKKRKGEK